MQAEGSPETKKGWVTEDSGTLVTVEIFAVGRVEMLLPPPVTVSSILDGLRRARFDCQSLVQHGAILINEDAKVDLTKGELQAIGAFPDNLKDWLMEAEEKLELGKDAIDVFEDYADDELDDALGRFKKQLEYSDRSEEKVQNTLILFRLWFAEVKRRQADERRQTGGGDGGNDNNAL